MGVSALGFPFLVARISVQPWRPRAASLRTVTLVLASSGFTVRSPVTAAERFSLTTKCRRAAGLPHPGPHAAPTAGTRQPASSISRHDCAQGRKDNAVLRVMSGAQLEGPAA